jgi:hypothetical protein
MEGRDLALADELGFQVWKCRWGPVVSPMGFHPWGNQWGPGALARAGIPIEIEIFQGGMVFGPENGGLQYLNRHLNV